MTDHLADPVGEEGQQPLGSDPGIELAQAAGSRIARVGEGLLATLELAPVERLEACLLYTSDAADDT